MAEKAPKVLVSSERRVAPSEAGRHPLFSLQREVDRLFDDFTRGFSMFPFGERGGDVRSPMFGWSGRATEALAPSVDVAETDKAFEISAELPGMGEEDIDVSLSDGILTLKGEKREESKQEDEAKGYYLSERLYGSFQRAFRLPDGVDQERIEAHFDKGVLKVTLPKTPEAAKRQRKIAVKKTK